MYLCTKNSNIEIMVSLPKFLTDGTQVVPIEDILFAANEVESRFPPKDLNDAMSLLASLNLLNASIKMPGGENITSYQFIKGYAGMLFVWLLHHPIKDVDLYFEKVDCLAYFRVPGYQFSFHCVRLLTRYRNLMKKLEPQQWDGIRLQSVALNVFRSLPHHRCEFSAASRLELIRKMLSFSKGDTQQILVKYRLDNILFPLPGLRRSTFHKHSIPYDKTNLILISPDRWQCLLLALKFNGFDYPEYELYHYGNSWRVKVARYSGRNYERMMLLFRRKKHILEIIPENQLVKGTYYYFDRISLLPKPITRELYYSQLAHHNNLIFYNYLYNICITYNMAVYFSELYPSLRFINILNYARLKVQKHVYTGHALKKVALHSKARTRKVWIVVDHERVLSHYNIHKIPKVLFDEYKCTPNYDSFYRITHRGDKVGLKAYSHFHLLPPVYAEICICGNWVKVLNDQGKWALYSLVREAFESEFVCDRIWLSLSGATIYGEIGGKQVELKTFARDMI